MSQQKRLMECVPNFSEGRDPEKMEKIVSPFRGKAGVKLLDYQNDEDHNRMVVTVLGEPRALKAALMDSLDAALEVIDMREHNGQHPRMGAVDVVPFIPLGNSTMKEAVELSLEIGEAVSEKHDLPIFLYEESASVPERRNLSNIRKGQFEGMAEKLKKDAWKPDFGPARPHPTAGVTAMGARMPLVAFNVNLGTRRLEIADAIAKKVRFISGGLRHCKAIGVDLGEKGMVQVSMNMTNYKRTSLYTVMELIRAEAKRYGVAIVGSEVVGLLPVEALVDSAAYYMRLDGFSMDQLLELRVME